MNKKTPFMGTTEVAPARSIAAINDCLIQAGARQISTTFGEGGKPTGVTWVMVIHGNVALFTLPVKVDACFAALKKLRKTPLYTSDVARLREQAERVAWRQLFRWVEAQIAMIQTGMVEAGEVFSPYLTNDEGKTMWQMLTETRFKALPAPEPK